MTDTPAPEPLDGQIDIYGNEHHPGRGRVPFLPAPSVGEIFAHTHPAKMPRIVRGDPHADPSTWEELAPGDHGASGTLIIPVEISFDETMDIIGRTAGKLMAQRIEQRILDDVEDDDNNYSVTNGAYTEAIHSNGVLNEQPAHHVTVHPDGRIEYDGIPTPEGGIVASPDPGDISWTTEPGEIFAVLHENGPMVWAVNVADTEALRNLARWALEEMPELSCPYLLGTGTCNQGCRDEPRCHTGGPLPVLTQRVIDWALEEPT